MQFKTMIEQEMLVSELTRLFPFNGIKWGNEPIPYGIDEYESAKKRFVAIFTANPNVRSIYQFGFIKHPGISDLDFLIILHDKPARYALTRDIYAPFSQKERYLYNNTPPFIINKEIFCDFYKILPLSNLTWLSGEIIEQEKNKDDTIFNLLILIEICSYFYPKVFLELFKEKTFNTRRAILLLNSLQYTLSLAAGIIGENSEWTRFNIRVQQLRGEWFDGGEDKYKRLYDLLFDAIFISAELIEKLGIYLQKGSYLADSIETKYIGHFLNRRMLFAKEFKKETALNGILKVYKRSGKFISILPPAFLSPLLIYKDNHGQISRHIRRNLSVEVEIPSFHNLHVAKERIRLLNYWVNFIEENKITVDMVHIYYGYRPGVCLKNRLINFLITHFNI